MKIINKIGAIFAFILLFLAIGITYIDIFSFDKNFYRDEYEKNKTYQVIDISKEDLDKVTVKLLSYIKDKENNIEIKAVINNVEKEVFNEKEKLHMVDVKNLYQAAINFRNIALILAISILIFVYFMLDKKYKLLEYLRKAVYIFILFILCIIVYALLDFNSFWLNFHYIFFDNDLFFLDPSKDILIMMVPLEFFMDLVFKIVKYYVFTIAGLYFLSFYRRKKYD